MLAGVNDPDYQGVRLLIHNREKEEYIWDVGGPLGCLLILSCSMIKVNEKL